MNQEYNTILSQDHLKRYIEGSGIALDVAQERAYRTSTGLSELKSCGITVPRGADVHGLLVPLHTVEGTPGTAYLLKEDRSVPLVVYRFDTAPMRDDGSELRYLYPANQRQRLDCPPRCQPLLNNPAVTLWVTEGQRKADALASHGLCALDVLGVENWRILGDWQHVALAGRDVRIVHDSDWLTKKEVKRALYALRDFLRSQGARVSIVSLPSPDGRKVGADDYLITHTLADLEQLCGVPQGQDTPRSGPAHAIRISARAVKAKKHPPLNFVVDKVLPAGCTLMTGKSKDGKSMMAYNIGVAVASGGLALGTYATMAGSVWYLALEDGERRAQDRLALQEAQMGPLSDEALDRLEFTLWEAPRLGAGLEEDIRTWIETTPDARLVIIDILEKVRPPRKLGGSTYAEDYTATSSLTKLAEAHNVAILILHHSNKSNPADFRDSASGAMSLVGGADNFWSLNRQPLSEDATLKVTGRDIPHEYDLAMQFKDGYWTALGEARLVVMSSERQAIVDVLQDRQRALTPTQIAQATGKNVNTIKILLRKMLTATVVMQPTEGHYALSPSYLSTQQLEREGEKEENTVNPINPINCVNPVNPVNPIENIEVTADTPVTTPPPSPDTVYGGFTPVYGGFTAEENTQTVENADLNGGTVYGFTGFTGITPAVDCLSGNPHSHARERSSHAREAPCPHPETKVELIPEDGSSMVRCTTCHRVVGVIPPERRP